MSIYDGRKGDAPGDDLRAEPSLAEAMRGRNDFRVREKTAMEQENEGLPSVNRRKGGNKLVTLLGFVFILGAAAALIVAVNADKEATPKKNSPNEDKIANNLPPLTIPAAPPPIAVAPPTVPVREQVPPIKPASKPTGGKEPPHWSERKRSGTLLITNSGQAQNPARPVAAQEGGPNQSAAFAGQGGRPAPNNELSARLEATETRGVSAALLPDRNFLITKGTTLDCALETALDSTVPGITTCRLTRDVYSDNGQVLLLDRGSQLVGEYQGGLRQGQVRLFVLWTRAKTPNGVVVSLDSPGTDALGRSGLEGWVDNHFLERFGAAILMSLVQDSVTAIANNTGGGGTTNIYGSTASGGERVIEKILESTVNIPPTIIKNQGDHIQVMAARDLDFSSVYALRVKP